MRSSNHRRLFPLVTLGLLLIVGWVLVDRAPEITPPEQTTADQADYFVDDFTVTATRPSGEVEYRLTASSMQHYPKAATWHFTAPHLLFYPTTGEPWRVTAEKGKAWSDGDDILLQGPVAIRRASGPVNRPMNVDTFDLHLKPNDDYAFTDRQTVLYSGGMRMTGVGARAYMDQQKLELLSQVKGRYVPDTH